MNNNTMELNLNEMATVTGGDVLDHVEGAFDGAVVCGLGGLIVGGIIGGGVAGGILGLSGIRKLFS